MPPRPSGETSIIVALLEEIQGLRKDTASQTETLSKKIDEAQAENRDEFKEIRKELAENKARLAEGSEKLRNLRRDVDQQGERCLSHGTTALEKKQRKDETEPQTKRKKVQTWQAVLLTAILSGIGASYGPVLFQKVVDALATKPAPVAVAPQVKP